MIVSTVSKFRKLVSEALVAESSAVDVEGAKEVLKRFPKGMKKVGVDVAKVDTMQPLGTGTRGTAFDVGSDRVVKVTNDAKEAQAASALVGKDIPGIVRFYAVWKFGDSSLYGVLQEKLEPISDEEGKEFNAALVATGLPVWIKRSGGDWNNAKALTKQYVLDNIKKKFAGNMNSPEAQAFAKKANEGWNNLVTKWRLRDTFKTLTEIGIDFHDYHAGNMMRRKDGTLVLIDLGMSNIRAQGGEIETVTEGVKK